MQSNDNNKNRGAHGDSLRMLDEVSSSNKNPPASAMGSANVTDHPASYYQQLDITDPTPYETDTRILDGEECMICGEEFRIGERIMEMKHRELSHDRFLFHEDCLRNTLHDEMFTTLWDFYGFMEDFGFEVDETEVSD